MNQSVQQFDLGRVVMTPTSLDVLPASAVESAQARHAAGDWGEVGPEDAAENERSLSEGFRLLSVYRAGYVKFWIITEADRSTTTILLPEDTRRNKQGEPHEC